MEIVTRQHNGVAIVAVQGRIVRENQAELRQAIEALVGEGLKGVALDLGKVDYVDSAGLGCCAAIQKLLKDKRCGSLAVFRPAPSIERMWKLIRLDLVIPLFREEKEALARLENDASAAGP
ncbi:MAG: STAS domain-containing protein [Thermoanaerobaculia bacterium]